MNFYKTFYPISLIILVIIMAIFGWQYIDLRQEFNDLENEINQQNKFSSQNNLIDPPNGQADSSGWSQVKNETYNFSLLYPQTWLADPSGENMVIPQNFSSNQNDSKNEAPLTLTISTNTEISNSWRKIALASGEAAYYNFEEIFDHYYMVNNNKMLIWTIPVRSYNGLYTDQQLKEAVQIVNTYHSLDNS